MTKARAAAMAIFDSGQTYTNHLDMILDWIFYYVTLSQVNISGYTPRVPEFLVMAKKKHLARRTTNPPDISRVSMPKQAMAMQTMRSADTATRSCSP
jgi:hypothetical protein